MTMSSFSLQKRWHNLLCLFLIAILIRSLVFAFYIAPHEFYLQPDSRDYHYCACSLAAGHGMAHPDNLYPTFWRTPGYPLYLTIFYRIFGVQSLDFLKNKKQLEASIWVQILLCSLLPVLLFFLALHLTASSLLAWCVAWISVFHLGFVLATNYILSDALASLLLMIFFLFFYRITRFIGEPRMRGIHYNASVMNICGAAFFLGLYIVVTAKWSIYGICCCWNAVANGIVMESKNAYGVPLFAYVFYRYRRLVYPQLSFNGTLVFLSYDGCLCTNFLCTKNCALAYWQTTY